MLCFEREGGSETEREEQPRGGGAQFRQEIPAEKVGLPPNYTAPCQQLYTNAHVPAYTLRNTHTQTLISSPARSTSSTRHVQRARFGGKEKAENGAASVLEVSKKRILNLRISHSTYYVNPAGLVYKSLLPPGQ